MKVRMLVNLTQRVKEPSHLNMKLKTTKYGSRTLLWLAVILVTNVTANSTVSIVINP
jgi:hypothetical protein